MEDRGALKSEWLILVTQMCVKLPVYTYFIFIWTMMSKTLSEIKEMELWHKDMASETHIFFLFVMDFFLFFFFFQ